MQIAIHDAGHELDRMVRLQPTGLVADNGIGRCVRFVETVVGELVEKVPNLQRLFVIDPVFLGAGDELRAFSVHCLLDLLTHRATKKVGATKAIARHLLRDLHHLFLIDDDALRLVQNVVDGRMKPFTLGPAVLHVAILRNVLHRPGTVERDKRHDVFDRRGFHAPQRVHHAGAFHLKHGNSAGLGVKFVSCLVVEGYVPDVVLGAGLRRVKLRPIRADMKIPSPLSNLVDGVLDDGQRLQAKEVKFHQPGLFHPLHVELGGRHLRSRVAVKGHKLVQRTIPDHDTSGVGRGISQKTFDLLTIVQQPLDDLFGLGLFSEAWFICQRLLNADRLDPFNRDQFRQPIDLAIGHLQYAADVTHGCF